MDKDSINNCTESHWGSSQETAQLHLQSCAASGKWRKWHSYSISTKREAIAHAEKESREAEVWKFGTYATGIQEWCKKKADFETAVQASQRKRLHGNGRKPHLTELEKRVLDWIHDMSGHRLSAFPWGPKARKKRSFGMCLSHRTKQMSLLALKAMQLKRYRNKHIASNGWVFCIINRHRLTKGKNFIPRSMQC